MPSAQLELLNEGIFDLESDDLTADTLMALVIEEEAFESGLVLDSGMLSVSDCSERDALLDELLFDEVFDLSLEDCSNLEYP